MILTWDCLGDSEMGFLYKCPKWPLTLFFKSKTKLEHADHFANFPFGPEMESWVFNFPFQPEMESQADA